MSTIEYWKNSDNWIIHCRKFSSDVLISSKVSFCVWLRKVLIICNGFVGQWNKNWQSIDLKKIIDGNNFFCLRHITTRHWCQLSIIRFFPKYIDQTLVNFSASPPGDWQTRCLWWEVVQSWFHVDLKSNFALKNNSMEFLPGPITRRINVLYELRMKWTWHYSKLAVEEVSFIGGVRVVLQLLSIHNGAVGITNLGVMLLCSRCTVIMPKHAQTDQVDG